MRIAKIEYFKCRAVEHRWRVVNCRQHAGDDVIHVRVIPAGLAISENWQRLAFFDERNKFVYGEIGPLARAKNRKKPQENFGKAGQMRLRIAKRFSSQLPCSA